MTREELEKATGQELIDARNYCGVDGYYSSYLDNVNAEMLKRFNCLADIEKENAELKRQVEQKQHLADVRLEQSLENYKLFSDERKARIDVDIALDNTTEQLTYAKTIIQDLLDNTDEYARQRAEDFLKECE